MTNEDEVLDLLFKYVSDWNCASADEYPYFTDELGHACNDVIRLVDDKNKENTKLKAEIEELKSKIVSLNYENTGLKEEVGANILWSNVVERTLKKEVDKNVKLCEEITELKMENEIDMVYNK